MKKKTIQFILLSLVSLSACAQLPVFTCLNTNGPKVFAGVKISEQGMEPDTYLMEVNSTMLSSQKISLPKELIHREVVGIFPTQGEVVLVLTQRTVEQGDNPLLYSFHPSKKEWKKVAEFKCPSFANVSVEESALTLHCVETNKEGVEVKTSQKTPIAGLKLKASGEQTLPLFKVEKDNVKAELVGESFEWKELKVSVNKKEKVFKP